MIDPRVMVRRVVLLTNTTVLLGGAGIFAAMVLIARFVAAPRGLPAAGADLVDYGFGASAVVVGLFLLPTMIVATAAGSALGPVSRRYGWKWPLVISMATLTMSLALFGGWHARAWQVLIATTLLGVSLGLSTIGAKLVADAVRPAEHAVVAGVNMVAFYIGGVIGTQGVTAILDARRIPGTALPTEAAYTLGLLLLAGATTVGLMLAVLVQPVLRTADGEALVGATGVASAGTS